MRTVPWIIAGLLAVACAGLVFYAQHEVTRKNELIAKLVKALENEKLMDARIKELQTALTLKPLPLKIATRNAGPPEGGVLMIENKGDQNLTLTILVKRGDDKHTQLDNIAVGASGQKSVGQADGWAFLSGDLVEISSAGYRTAHLKYP